MNTQPFSQKNHYALSFFITLLAAFFISFDAYAQAQLLEDEEVAICKVKVKDKDYLFKSNSTSNFPQISGLQPLVLIPIEVTYPKGKTGEKVILNAPQGGSFDNKKQVQVVQLDNQKNCSFTFQLTNNPGLFEITLRKGSDVKVISLWVGED